MAWGPFNAGGGGGSSGGTAADISYDNSKSGISAANVQEAIDALSVLTLTIQAVPAQSGSLTYTGSTQSPTWKGYDSSMMTIGGVTSGINAGTYTATFTPIGKYVWTDGTQEAKSVSWTIGRAEVNNVPAQTGSVTYNGSAQSPSWSNYNSSQLTIGGTSSATNAGSYSATFTPTSNYKWSDGTTTAKSASWTIGKATGSITLSASSLSLTYPKTSGTITVTRPGSGTVTASSGSTNIATVSVSGTTITVTAKATGSATITVNVGADTNYTAPSSKTFTVAVTLVSKTLSSNSWAVIKAVSDAGQGANYWSVGATKSVTINGKVGATTISSLKVDAFIHHPHGDVVGQDVDPGLMHIQQLAEHKAHHKAEQVAGHKLFAQQHQTEHQAPLEQVGPGAQREHGPHLGKGKGHAGNSRNARPGIEHQHHAKAVHQHGNAQCQFAAEQRQRF